jgi:autotransporter family porin
VPALPINWSSNMNYWSAWVAKRNQVTGNFTGTTTEIIQWAACKWGIDEDTIRAVAVQESSWYESWKGDICAGNAAWASWGLTQIKSYDCSGAPIWGGYPATSQHTALNVDLYAARLRSCYDGDFYDGGSWLYNGQTVQQIAAAKGWDYVFWGCVGSWFSGSWYDAGAQNYIGLIKNHLANRTWTTY